IKDSGGSLQRAPVYSDSPLLVFESSGIFQVISGKLELDGMGYDSGAPLLEINSSATIDLKGILVLKNNVNIYGMYSGLDVCESSYKNAIHIAAHTATLKISNCNWNFDKWITSLTALSPSKFTPVFIAVKKYIFENFIYKYPVNSYASTSGVRNGMITTDNIDTNKEFYITNSKFLTYNSYIFILTSALTVDKTDSPPLGTSSIRKFNNFVIEYISEQPPVGFTADSRYLLYYNNGNGIFETINTKIIYNGRTLEIPNTNATYSKMFKNLIFGEEKKAILSHFGLKKIDILENWMLCFATLRNICAHHSRVWNRRLIQINIPKDTIDEFLHNVNSQPNKLYITLSCMVYMLKRINPKCNFVESIKELVSSFDGPSKILKDMGFPPDWEQEKLWN
ncbi:MAG: Abi family protein, partial [Bacteroidales bacterium]